MRFFVGKQGRKFRTEIAYALFGSAGQLAFVRTWRERKLFWPKVESAAFSGAHLEDRAEI